MINLLKNQDFELGTCRDTFNGTVYNEIEVPQDWVAWWSEADGFYRPEMKVISAVAPYLDPPRINTGQKSLTFFGFYKKIKAGLYQQITVPNNSKLTFTISAHSWYSMRDNPAKSEWFDDSWHTIKDGDDGFNLSIGIDTTGNTDPFSSEIVWKTEHYYNGFNAIQLEIIASGLITLFIKGESDNPFKHCDCYFDTANLVVESLQTNCICPRIDYERTYHLLPQAAPLWAAEEVSRIAYKTRGTMGYSPDDAGIGPITRNVVAYYTTPNTWLNNELELFFEQFYPGINLTRVNLYSDPDPVEPPTINIQHPSNNYIGLHAGEPWAKWNYYTTQAKPNVAKCFSLGFALDTKQKALPGTLVVWRKHSDSYVDCVAPFYDNALKLVDYYDSEVKTAAKNMGISRDVLLEQMDGIVIESLNEKIPTFNEQQINKAVEFDRIFCELVKQKFNGHLRPAVLTAAIGNPHETEVHLLIPAVEAAIANNGLIGYHSYWTSNQNDNGEWLTEKWKFHAGRWTEWDKVFNEAGLYPEYYLGEGGIVYSNDGNDFNSGKGWRSCGSFDKYLAQINTFNSKVIEWNSTHNNRCYGLTVFHYGNWGWDNFKLGDGDITTLTNWAKLL
jgi:hypothetical protein